jgi:hypothetical protein
MAIRRNMSEEKCVDSFYGYDMKAKTVKDNYNNLTACTCIAGKSVCYICSPVFGKAGEWILYNKFDINVWDKDYSVKKDFGENAMQEEKECFTPCSYKPLSILPNGKLDYSQNATKYSQGENAIVEEKETLDYSQYAINRSDIVPIKGILCIYTNRTINEVEDTQKKILDKVRLANYEIMFIESDKQKVELIKF